MESAYIAFIVCSSVILFLVFLCCLSYREKQKKKGAGDVEIGARNPRAGLGLKDGRMVVLAGAGAAVAGVAATTTVVSSNSGGAHQGCCCGGDGSGCGGGGCGGCGGCGG
ncbi:PREDICTED: chorion class high-cysteine HCB protein 13-like [Nicotiana attenuata]|uniref:chorion class high-cysteine HCB protein 13-like n=1 Tax=Nicotiana attenuata TaxID=49451 RepID=UPI00090522EE|nr:PREDICTED: chorion class high-cysteine HCB protein 13-like [Nicotiana attenuata]